MLSWRRPTAASSHEFPAAFLVAGWEASGRECVGLVARSEAHRFPAIDVPVSLARLGPPSEKWPLQSHALPYQPEVLSETMRRLPSMFSRNPLRTRARRPKRGSRHAPSGTREIPLSVVKRKVSA